MRKRIIYFVTVNTQKSFHLSHSTSSRIWNKVFIIFQCT